MLSDSLSFGEERERERERERETDRQIERYRERERDSPGRVALDILPENHLLLFSGALPAESARFGVWGLGCEIQGGHNTLRN